MRILGCDYGERRMGLAVSDPDGMLALVLRTEEVADDAGAAAALCAAAGETGAERIVIGLPLNMDGTDSEMTRRVRAFAARVAASAAVPVATWDERLSTGLVERALVEADVSRRKRRKVRDRLAAQVILQGYLDAQAAAGPSAG